MTTFIHGDVAIIGLGYIGLPLAIEFSTVRRVIAYDINNERINELLRGYDKTNEISSSRLSAAENILFTSDSLDLKKAKLLL